MRSGMGLWASFIRFGRSFTGALEGGADSGSNAGGGGERVLWAAIIATQKRWPKAKCIVYTGDHDVDKAAIIDRVKVLISNLQIAK